MFQEHGIDNDFSWPSEKNQDDSHENSRGREFPLSFETNSQLTSVLHISGLGVGPASCNEASVLVFIFSIVCCYVFVAIHFSLFNYGFLSANLRYTAVGCWPNLLVFLNYDAIYDSLFDFILLWCAFQPEDVMKNISRIASPLSWYVVWKEYEGLKWHHQNQGRRLTMQGCVLM